MSVTEAALAARESLEMGAGGIYIEFVGSRLGLLYGTRGELRCVNARGNAVGFFDAKRLLKNLKRLA